MDKENHQKVEKKLEGVKKCIWKMDNRMLPYKLHYFLFMSAMGAVLPYHQPIGITRLGLKAGNFAVTYTIQQFLLIAFKPLIGYTVDYFNNLKKMIVILTFIFGILAYLLLAIPTLFEENVKGNKDDFQVQKETVQVIFCKLCTISSKLETMAERIPVASEDFLNEFLCVQENHAPQILAGRCPKNLNSSIKLDNKLVVEIRIYYTIKSKLNDSQNIDVKLLSNKSSTIFIKLFCQWNSTELEIICPNIEPLSDIHVPNFTLSNIVKSCFKYPQAKVRLNNIKSKKYLKFSNKIVCNESEVSKEDNMSEPSSFKSYQFWLYTLFILISRTSANTVFTLSDTACHEAAQKTGTDFGNQRAWGAIGWGFIAPFSGFLNDYTGDYWVSMMLMSFLLALQIWNLTKVNLVKPQYSPTIFKDIKTILSSGVFIAFEIGIFLNGIGFGLLFYLAWFITDIGGSRLLIGLVHFVQCFLGEMPFMFLSGWLIKKFGHFNVVSMALLGYGIRFLAYSSLKIPWMILPIECLEGITFGAFYTSMTSFGKRNAKPGTEATTQSLLATTYEGLGTGIGCLIGGACFDYFGGYTTFFYAGLFFIAAFAVNVASTALLHFSKSSKKPPQETSVESRY